MKRPVGLLLSVIGLSLAALFLLLSTALTAFAAIFSNRQPSPAIPPHFLFYLMLFTSVFYAALAAWAIMTVVGILRLRPWARYSILIIGGGLAFLGFSATLFSIVVRRTMLAGLQAQQPPADPHLLSIVLISMTAIYLFIGGVGLWWLTYFNLSSTRELFLNSSQPTPTNYDSTNSYQPPPHPHNPRILLQPKPGTGFFSSPAHAPAAVRILGSLALVGAVFCLPLVFLPIPAFLMGYILPTPLSHFVYLAILIANAFIGFGLLKLKNSARLAAIVFMLFGCCNSAIGLLPGSMGRFKQYADHLMAVFPRLPNQPIPSYTPAMFTFNILFGMAICLAILWLLHRHRAAFQFSAPPPPPLEA
jgi:hypothetical protein